MAPKTIILKGKGIRKERPAGAAGIRPGDLVAINASGEYIVHAAADLTAIPAFAVENELAGKDITDNYLDVEQVLVEHCHAGMEVYAWIADGETIVIGDFLDSDGDGSLKEVDTSAATAEDSRSSLVAMALEALSPSGADGRIRVEVL